MKKLLLLTSFLLMVPGVALGQFTRNWNVAYEATPADTDLVSGGDDRIRDLKLDIRERMETQHYYGDGTHDTAVHREGSAWALTHATDCTAVAITADHDDGRLCYEIDGGRMWIIESGAWVELRATPLNSIILWDELTDGDENCDGVTTAGDCPCGYEEIDAFRGLTIRGADSAGAELNIPDSAGESCVGDGSANDPPCVTQAGRYDDTITTVQMPGHTHDVPHFDGGGLADVIRSGDSGAAPGAPDEATTSTGGDDDHYHPFRTVLFCRKT